MKPTPQQIVINTFLCALMSKMNLSLLTWGRAYFIGLWCKRGAGAIISITHHFSPSLFRGRHFDRSIIVLCVR